MDNKGDRPDKSDWIEPEGFNSILKARAKNPTYLNKEPFNMEKTLKDLDRFSAIISEREPLRYNFNLHVTHSYNVWLNYIAAGYYPRYFLKRVIVANKRELNFVGRHGGVNCYLSPDYGKMDFDFKSLKPFNL